MVKQVLCLKLPLNPTAFLAFLKYSDLIQFKNTFSIPNGHMSKVLQIAAGSCWQEQSPLMVDCQQQAVLSLLERIRVDHNVLKNSSVQYDFQWGFHR